ncbi:MAG: hypothetical protein N3E40_01815, partial [Dehalococcoidia bacterium]|nr:hypothetical protein [Dehalococcoidia bacterium]
MKTAERVTRIWWFFLIVLAVQFLPPLTSRPIDPAETYSVIATILSNSLVSTLKPVWPVFQVLPVLLVISLVVWRNRAARAFSLYAGLSYVVFAFVQNMAFGQSFGSGVITSNIVMFLALAGFWFWEARVRVNDFRNFRPPMVRWLVVPAAFFAFWMPIDWQTRGPLFDPLLLFTSGSGLAFCMMTPVY